MTASEWNILREMDKAITEMEIAMVVIKPELRALAENFSMKSHAKKQNAHKKKKDAKVKTKEKEKSHGGHKDKEKDKGSSKRDRSKSASVSTASPVPLRHRSDPSITTIMPQAPGVSGLISSSTTLASGHYGGGAETRAIQNEHLFPSGSPMPSVLVTTHGTVGSTKSHHHHKGIKGIFRRSSSASRTVPPYVLSSSPSPSQPSTFPNSSKGSPLLLPSSPYSNLQNSPSPSHQFSSHSSSTPTTPRAVAYRPSSIGSNSLLSESSPAISQLSLSLFNLRQLHSSLSAKLTPSSTLSANQQQELERAAAEDAAARFARQRERAHVRSSSTSSMVSNVLSVWYDAEQVFEEEDEDNEPTKREEEDSDNSSEGSSDDVEEFEDVEDVTSPSSDSGTSFPSSNSTSTLMGPSGFDDSKSMSTAIQSSKSSSSLLSTSSSSSAAGADLRASVETTRPAKVQSETVEATTTVPVPVKSLETPIPICQLRTSLPAQTPRDEGSLISVLRKSVGKDMSQISMPVTFNEPLSLLQRAAEDVEYFPLLSMAVNSIDPVERLAHVAAFAISGYASTKLRNSRKPFNPMLGETFEYVQQGLKFVAEKVSHHPPIIVSHATGEGWHMKQTSSAKNKLSGMSLEISPKGPTTVYLEKSGETFSWTKPPSYIRNLVAGTKYVETIGPMEIYNLTTGDVCHLNFKEGGWGGSGRNVVSGYVLASGSKAAWIEGKWDSRLDVRYGSAKDPAHMLWQARQWPSDAEKYYGWGYFTMSLNQLDPSFESLLPRTDSRFNPSQRYLEEGNVDAAEETKLILETRQRARNRARDERGEKWKPLWFEAGPDGESWEFGGQYWDTRALHEFKDPGLFDL
ncbi:Oxysterol-binding protein [Phaffia rhodozyma]|uniref:Oxysterol-binding protein n=1 Tax=Phaffia rhodozyma TaxID=264483 RepID=A0A0F7SVN1_PHARH|nr:Oxysterol-binding protein [Phaffia rhodozyma]